MKDKIYDVDLPQSRFTKFQPVIYLGQRTEIANDDVYCAYDNDGVMCAWRYIAVNYDDFITIELVPETALSEVSDE